MRVWVAGADFCVLIRFFLCIYASVVLGLTVDGATQYVSTGIFERGCVVVVVCA